jgi:hypothetical protein
LHVIEEQEQEIELLNAENMRLREDCDNLQGMINHREQSYDTEINMIKQKCQDQLSEKDRDMEELTMMM